MNSEKYLIETAKTVESAVTKAINKLECSRDEVDVEILDDGSKKKFMGLIKRPVTVKVGIKKDITNVKLIVENLLSLMGINGKVFERKEGSTNVLKILTAGYDGLLIGKGGKTLDALQYIVTRMAKKSGISAPFYITVGDYKRAFEKHNGSR